MAKKQGTDKKLWRKPAVTALTPEQIAAAEEALSKDLAQDLINEAGERLYKALKLLGKTSIKGTAEFSDGARFTLTFVLNNPPAK